MDLQLIARLFQDGTLIMGRMGYSCLNSHPIGFTIVYFLERATLVGGWTRFRSRSHRFDTEYLDFCFSNTKPVILMMMFLYCKE